MARTAWAVTQYGADDAGVSATWQNVDIIDGIVLADPKKVTIIARNANAATRVMRLVSTQKGVTVNKDYTIPGNATFGTYILEDIDMTFWGKHGASDAGALYVNWPDCGAATEVQVAVIRRP